MPSSRCVVEGCNNQASRKKGLSVHLSPSAGKRRKVWLKFVNTHRENFPPVTGSLSVLLTLPKIASKGFM